MYLALGGAALGFVASRTNLSIWLTWRIRSKLAGQPD